MISETLSAAIDARRREDITAFEGSLDVLAGIATDELSAALVDGMTKAVGDDWSRGWQPVDLARAVSRRYGAKHNRIVVDMVAARVADAPLDTVDERWTDQLRSLETNVWWPTPEAYLKLWAGRERVDVIMATRYAVEVLELLESLPAIPHLHSPPGAAARTRRPRHAPAGRMLDRVRSLLAKAESSQFTAEAEAYTAKAQELIARHSIDTALLAKDDDKDQPVAVRVTVDSPYEEAKALLLQNVAEANLCRSVWSSDLGFATVFGFADDVEAVELLYGSLLVQGTATMVREGSAGRSRAFRQSFLFAYAVRIGQRLTEAAQDTRAESTAEALLPVLASRETAVEQRVAELFATFTSRRVRVNDERGWSSGTAAADRARFSDRRVRS